MRYKWKLQANEGSVDYFRILDDGRTTNLMGWIWLPQNPGIYRFSVNKRHRKDNQHCQGECKNLREAMRMVKLIVAIEDKQNEAED
jgi:hypothetical protein